ncbi:MAG: PAS domain-containing protein [Acidobacteria bacterium]|nr:PAS domain-containing protein [Acidobacteriota bacterium]
MHVDLEARLKRLMLFRVVMVTTLLFIATYVEAVLFETLLRVNPFYFVIVATYVLTVGHAIALRFVSSRLVLAHAQVVGDLLIITALVLVTGGVRTGFLLLYPLSVLSATMLVPRRQALSIAGVATILYGGLLAAVRLGLVPPQGLSDVVELELRPILYSVFVLGVACATVAVLGSYLAESLQHAGHQLEMAEVEVADLRELNQVIVDSIQSGLIMTDAEGHIRHVNAFGEGILGRRASALLTMPLRDVLGSNLLGSAELRARAASRALARLELRYHHPGGSELDLGVSVTPLATAEAARGGYLVVFQDLTDVRRLEAELRTNEKLAAVGEMAAQLAHEIRNPLGSIRGSAQVLAGEPGFSADQGHLLTIISRESKRLSDTLNRFLFQARSSGKPRDVVDLRPLLEEAVTLLRNGPEIGPDHAVRLETDDGPHLCLADRDQITQVFWNLARNGLEAMPEGGDLVVSLRRVGADVVLTVRDQGRGMAREEQRRVFEPFQSSSAMGTGLGLAIVYRIVREHGGDISVRSAPARGTEVELRLPLVAVAQSMEASR